MQHPTRDESQECIPDLVSPPAAGDLDLLAYVPCPVKQSFRDFFDTLSRSQIDATGESIRSYIPMGCHNEDPYEHLVDAETIEEVPEVIVSMGYGDFWTPSFCKRFVQRGRFASVPMPSRSRCTSCWWIS